MMDKKSITSPITSPALSKILIYILLRKMTDNNILAVSRILHSFEPRFSTNRKCNIISTVYDKIEYVQFTYEYITKHFHNLIDENYHSDLETPNSIIQLYMRMYHKSFEFIPQILETNITIHENTIHLFLNSLIEFRRKYEAYRYNRWGKYIAHRYAHFDLYLLNHIESFL
jgi:hypothetical protein